jgi:hypothetical protein
VGRAFLALVGEQLERTVKDAARRDQPVGRVAQHVCATAQHDHFEAAIVVEMHVHRGVDLVAELVLHRRQPLGQVAHVVIVNDGERSDGLDWSLHRAAHHLGAREIAEHGGARALALSYDVVELLE